jgi:hypothetical protein
MTREKVALEFNVPVLVTLKYSVGKPMADRGYGPSVLYSTVDDRSLFVDLETSTRISQLQLQAGESFMICKQKREGKSHLSVWLSPATEMMRAQKESPEAFTPPSEVEQQMAGTLANLAEGRPAAAPRPIRVPPAIAQAPQQLGTGTNGPVAMRAPGPVKGWSQFLLDQTTTLIDVYAAACEHAESRGVPPAVVRTLLLSSFINVSKKGGCE